jgi:hypothetical protein
MITLNLTAKNTEQEVVKQYLEENASEMLAEKINNGVAIERDGKTLINRKSLDGFMKYATEEARKQAEKGASSACVRSDVVFGWAIHYFEEDSIIGVLYNEDGTEYKAPKPEVKKVAKTTTNIATVKKPESSQLSLFDFSGETPMVSSTVDEEVDQMVDESVDNEVESGCDEPIDVTIDNILSQEKKVEISPLYTRYVKLSEQYPTTIVALRVGDFYEVFGEKAELVAEKLELTLTSRDFGLEERVPMVGFPYHRVDVYREKIQEFSSVAIVESEDDVIFHLKKVEDRTDFRVDTETGEVIESPKDSRIDDLIGILFGILKDDVEVKL